MSLIVKLERFVDKSVGSFLIFLIWMLSLPFPNRFPTKIEKVLVIKLWALGDSVVMLPMLNGLRKNFPKAEIDVLARKRNRSVFEGSKDLNKIFVFEWSQPKSILNLLSMLKHYDVVIDAEPYLNISALIAWYLGKFRIGFSHGFRRKLYNNHVLFSKRQHMVQNYLDMLRSLGVKYNTDKLINLNYSESDKRFIDEFMKKNKIGRKDLVVGISPGVAESVKARMWPVENVARLIDMLIDKMNAKVMIADSKENRYIYDEIMSLVKTKKKENIIDAVGLRLTQFFCLITRCRVFVSNDTGPMHIAAAQGVKTIGLFGPNTPVLWAPYGKGNISIYKSCSTGPFIDNAKGYMPDRLTDEQANCMRQISVEEVFNAVKRAR